MTKQKIFQISLGEKLNALLSQLGCNESKEVVTIKQCLSACQVSVSKSQKDIILNCLAELLLNEKSRTTVIGLCTSILPELYFRILTNVKQIISDGNNILPSLHCSIEISLCLVESSCILFQQIVDFMKWLLESMKIDLPNETLQQFLLLVYLCCTRKRTLLSGVVSSEFLTRFCQSEDEYVKWFSNKILLMKMNVPCIESELRKLFSELSFNKMVFFEEKCKEKMTFLSMDSPCNESTADICILQANDFHGPFTPLFDVLFTKKEINDVGIYGDSSFLGLNLTQSATDAMKSITYGVLTHAPVLLFGDTGCGKTVLVESLAGYLGRRMSPDIVKIQLGELTDSKSLLGTYVSNGKTSQFQWQPGTLTQALHYGSWVLLEDINMAPADVLATLVGLIKSNRLVVPGTPQGIQPAEGFQLFLTTRGKVEEQSNTGLTLLYKLCHYVNVRNFTKEDLVLLIQSKFPVLSSVVEKIIDIYSMVSVDDALISNNDVQFSKLKLKNTTRDVLKWCSRLCLFEQALTQEHMFLSAMQCFCSTLFGMESVNVAYSIGAKLGITKEKVEYFLTKYKPVLNKSDTTFQVGKGQIARNLKRSVLFLKSCQKFAHTRHSLKLLEDIVMAVVHNEPILLVGETGCGKTSTVQYLAEQCGHKVTVVNMSQQSDIADLIGGFKPVDAKHLLRPVKDKFEELFSRTFPQDKNAKFLGHFNTCFGQRKWDTLVKLMQHCCKKALLKNFAPDCDMKSKWQLLIDEVEEVSKRTATQQSLMFDFIEGALVECLKSGSWLLLDEINLASAETLEYLSGLLDSKVGSLLITERGDMEEVKRHKNFRFFACMNPATDVGKKLLPYGIHNRFTEIYVEDIQDVQDLTTLVAHYLDNVSISTNLIDGIVRFYQVVCARAQKSLVDGSGQKPYFSLRTLCRALQFAASKDSLPPIRAVYEGLCLSFLTQLDRSSYNVVRQLIQKSAFDGIKNLASILKLPLPKPRSAGNWIHIQGYWLKAGREKPVNNESYVLTESVKLNIKDLARVVSGGHLPVLIQGETSVGKTSLITYLAQLTGNHCVRINNHEHVDIQEYIGSYTADDCGNLIFKEGVLVTAMRKGHWIILDELNLAPTDVLEALNRLLDDNRELYIAETQETVRAHSQFMLFATQNPPYQYGGRKVLSRAFRNRFVELHFEEIPRNELQEILHKRCMLPMSYCKKFVKVMFDLQVRRTSTGIFAGKHSFMTLRDLFRWAERYRLSTSPSTFYDWEQCISEDGYMLLAGRCRKNEERVLIKQVIEENFMKVIDLDKLYDSLSLASFQITQKFFELDIEEFNHIVWTFNMKRLAVLTARALQFNEPILLVGETGCGKTTICQMLAHVIDTKLYSVNCHMHTEAADFLGGLRPSRSMDDNNQKLFEWCDGPLVTSMQEGAMFLIDEISLADDSVLERLNSVLETERILVLAEKGESVGKKMSVCIIQAHNNFRLVATMNPGGDFGKKELSPALRNRFTEIWCPASDSDNDLVMIIQHNIKDDLKLMYNDRCVGRSIVDFLRWLKNTEVGLKLVVSIRDILTWVQFINKCCDDEIDLSLEETYIHGACLVFIDAIASSAKKLKREAIVFLCKQVGLNDFEMKPTRIRNDTLFGIHPFFIDKGPICFTVKQYALHATTTQNNALCLLRGLKLSRPVLLEGSPGVGKTSLVVAIAKMSGHDITRINLSEETDVSDLFGADLPVEGAQKGLFSWRDGPLLQAMKKGDWVIFDELNLASQSVLEGLNACFDHRGEVFVPELNKTFTVKKDRTKIFACQNPYSEGSGRKGLPKSFLNRFTKVYVSALDNNDLLKILESLYNKLDVSLLEKMVQFNDQLYKKVVIDREWGKKGGPWEFNVRDLIRWCELVCSDEISHPGDFVPLIYLNRMRTLEDRYNVAELYAQIFEDSLMMERRKTAQCSFILNNDVLKIGFSQLSRPQTIACNTPNEKDLQLLRYTIPYLEALLKIITMKWMAILVGTDSSGKNSLVHMLARLIGRPLQVLEINSGMDTMDIIGGFEQVNETSKMEELIQQVIEHINNMLSTCLQTNQTTNILELMKERDLLMSLLKEKEMATIVLHVRNCLEKLQQNTTQNSAAVLDSFWLQLNNLNTSAKDGGQFHWVDGTLIQAIKCGHWIVLENANFCSPAVLDRLNGLLEPNGVLTVDERGVVNGNIPQIKPHKDFRIFMSMNPKMGEISRAMRNRGVELFVLSEQDGVQLDKIDQELLMKSVHMFDTDVASVLQNNQQTGDQRSSSNTALINTAQLYSTLRKHGLTKLQSLEHTCHKTFIENGNRSPSHSILETHLSSKFPSIQEMANSPMLSMLKRNSLTLVFGDEISLLLFMERIPLKHFLFSFQYLREHYADVCCASLIDRSEVEGLLNELAPDFSLHNALNTVEEDGKPFVRRLYMRYLLLFGKMNGLYSKEAVQGSLLHQSKVYGQGPSMAPQKVFIYLYKFCEEYFAFLRDVWLKNVGIQSQEHFAELEGSLQWFYWFTSFCKTSTDNQTSLILHWKWLNERNHLLKNQGFEFSSQLKFLVDCMDKLLQHECCQATHQIHLAVVGQTPSYFYEEQINFMKQVIKMIRRMKGLPNDKVDTRLVLRLFKLASKVYVSTAEEQEMISDISTLENKIDSLSTHPSNNCEELQIFCASILSSALFQLCVCNDLLMDVAVHNLVMGFSHSTSIVKPLIYLAIVKQNFKEHFISSVYNELLTESYADNLKQKLSSCFPLLLFLDNHSSMKDGVCVSLHKSRSMKENIQVICNTLWLNSNRLTNQQNDFMKGELTSSFRDMCKVLNFIKCCLKSEKCVEVGEKSVLDVASMFQIMAEKYELLKGLNVPEDLWGIISHIDLYIRQLHNNMASMNEDIAVGVLSCLSGILMLYASKPVGKYDTVEEIKLRVHYLKKEVKEINMELSSRFDAEYIWSGFSPPKQSFTGISPVNVEHFTSNPERISCLLYRRQVLTNEIQQVSSQLPARPKVSEYVALCTEFEDFLVNVGGKEKFLNLINDCNFAIENQDNMSLFNITLQKLAAWNLSTSKFISKLRRCYPLYQDLTTIPIKSLQKCLVGAQLLHGKLQNIANRMPLNSLLLPSNLFVEMSNIWLQEPMKAIAYLASEPLENTELAELPGVDQLQMFLRQAALKKLNRCILKLYNKETNTLLKNLLGKLFTVWSVQKFHEKERELERESLFKFKSHCQEKSEDEIETELQEQLFPTYENDFEEYLDTLPSLEANTKSKIKHVEQVSVVNEDFVYSVIKSIYLRKEFTCKKPLVFELLMHSLPLLKMNEVMTGTNFDRCALGLFMTFSHILKEVSSGESIQPESFNIYVDCNMKESLQCRDILEDYLEYLQDLLKEFPEHPSLKQIERLILQLLSLNVQSPLMKFVTGFEILLGQSKNWEDYAASRVSLQKHLLQVSQKVIEWRTIELKGWQKLLDQTDLDAAAQVSKHWFQFYNLCENVLKENDDKDSLAVAVKQFLESSTVGQFKSRLELIQIMHVHLKENNFPEYLVNVMSNLHAYYKQFETSIKTYVMEKREPIEKELKGFVQITKWSDTNYHALKATVTKSHKTLRRFVQRYQKVLQEPIVRFFQDSTSFSSANIETSTENKVFHLALQINDGLFIGDTIKKEKPNLHIDRVETLQFKMKKHVMHISKTMGYGGLVETLDQFTGVDIKSKFVNVIESHVSSINSLSDEIIEGAKELQKDTITDLPKDKQKSARNLLQQQKRKALSSLFQELKKIGLSYRKGEALFSDQNDRLELPNIGDMTSKKFGFQSEIITMVESANVYYFRSLGKRVLFHTALFSPSKELGPREISRFKGLCGHLHETIHNQRSQLHHILFALKDLRRAENFLSESNEKKISDFVFPPQHICKKHANTINKKLFMAEQSLITFQSILDCGSPQNITSQCSTPFNTSQRARICQDDGSLMKHVAAKLKIYLDKLSDFALVKEESVYPYMWKECLNIDSGVALLKELSQEMSEIVPLFKVKGDEHSFADVIEEMNTHLKVYIDSYSVDEFHKSVLSNGSNEELFQEKLQKFITQMLLSVQRIIKKTNGFQDMLNAKTLEEQNDLVSGHLNTYLGKHFSQHLDFLQLQSITASWNDILCHIQLAFCDSSPQTRVYESLFNLAPLIHMFSSLVQFYAFHSVMLHRTSCKLLTVLYSVFTDLLEKGYCKPMEEETDVEGGGATEFEDVGPSGLGAGDGVKDVSDQIESEDQVEDTKHEEKKADDDEEKDDVQEEKEGIEMTDDFDSNLQDVEGFNKSSDDEEAASDDEEEEKHMGDVDAPEETLEQNMWSGDEQDDDVEEEADKGAEGKNSEMVANEENSGKEADKEEKENEVNLDDGKDFSEEYDDDKDEDALSDVDDNLDDKMNDAQKIEQMDDEMNEELEQEEESNELEEEQTELGVDETPTEEMDEEAVEENKIETSDEKENSEENTVNEEGAMSQTAESADITEHAPNSSDNALVRQENESDQRGHADNEGSDGQLGADSCVSKEQPSKGQKRKSAPPQECREDRTVDSSKSVEVKRRRATDRDDDGQSKRDSETPPNDDGMYEHLKDDSTSHHQLIIDSATNNQIKDQIQKITINDDDSEEMMEVEEDEKTSKEIKECEGLREGEIERKQEENTDDKEALNPDAQFMEDVGRVDETPTNEIESGFFTTDDYATDMEGKQQALERLRAKLESGLLDLSLRHVDCAQIASDMWLKYDRLTSGLSQQLCEQLRLVLEPTIASKMKGDYRTGKRLHMRKVIPYIASQFRKDKIWMRRKKKSKRKYEIVLAVDDSSSMVDNHSKQLAFESIAVITNALKLLEAGDLAICSFGEEARVVHPFNQPFSEQAGCTLLQQFSFEQKKTNISQLLNVCTLLLNNSPGGESAISKLLLIVSDGRGMFLEGKEVVKQAIRDARDSGVFIVFIILDSPTNPDSILDIRVPIFPPGGGVPQIKSYMEEFPFPFYVLLRDINSLPSVLGDAIRQWLELVTDTT